MDRALSPSEPWLFVPTENLTPEIRTDKTARQAWYQNPATRHNFYTAIEGANPNQRVSKTDNPPKFLHGIVGDFEAKLTDTEILEGIGRMSIKPAWIERSLGGGVHLLWLFPRPLPVESYDFAVGLLQAAEKWLQVDAMPGIDRPAFSDPTKLYANGCVWFGTGYGPVSENELQAFFVETGRAFNFVANDGIEIPLDKVEKALTQKYPNFRWPGPFELETSGPSFWIEGSQSANSAIVKAEGLFTFSAHAEKPFYNWSDILGAEFVKEFTTVALAKATSDIWHDGKKFYRKKKGYYVGMEMAELANYLKTTCGVKGSKLEQALNHIYSENFVDGVGPFIFRPSGLIEFQGKRKLNTADVEVMKPASGSQTWGPHGSFAFLSSLLDNIFTSEIQRDHFLAWWKYFYESGLNQCPMPGQVLFLAGGVATGKTLTSRELVGRSVGGYVDAASYLVRGESFNSHLFEKALWSMDDETISDSPQAAANVQAALKKATANSSHLANRKFAVACMLEWLGRIFITTNTDYTSSRMIGKLDNSSRDKISLFRCQPVSKIKFPSRPEILKLIDAELAQLLRWLVDWTPPDYVERDNRFGFRSYHEASLTDQAHQTSRSAPFQEILLEALEEYFSDNKTAKEWRGTTSRVIMLLHQNPMRDVVIKTLRLESVARYLEAVEKDGFLGCRVEPGPCGTRIWIFSRIGEPLPLAKTEFVTSNSSIFDK